MKVTGHRLKESIKFHMLLLNAAKEQFDASVYVFEDEKKPTPTEMDERIFHAERAIARLQTAQAWFNLHVLVRIDDGSITLAEAIKVIGGAGRREARWRSCSAPKKDRYNYNDTVPTRTEGEVRAKRAISYDAALEKTTASARFAAQLRAGIAEGNMVLLDVPDNLLRAGDLV